MLSGSCLAAYFETESWPGEGIPRFSAKRNILKLHIQPTRKSRQRKIRYQEGERLDYDKSKMITLKSVTLTARTEITDLSCLDSPEIKQTIKPGDTIEYLQYRAEGYITARYKKQICEIFIMDNEPKFDGLEKEPVVEWWVRVIDKNNKVQGWLLVDKAQINYLDREF